MKTALLALALCLTIPQAIGDTEPLGRLFLTPQQRQELDRLRQQEAGSDNRGSLTVNGEVRSSSGSRTRWINGQADWQGIGPAPAVPVGDSIDPVTGERRPLLGDGRIQAQPRQR